MSFAFSSEDVMGSSIFFFTSFILLLYTAVNRLQPSFIRAANLQKKIQEKGFCPEAHVFIYLFF